MYTVHQYIENRRCLSKNDLQKLELQNQFANWCQAVSHMTTNTSKVRKKMNRAAADSKTWQGSKKRYVSEVSSPCPDSMSLAAISTRSCTPVGRHTCVNLGFACER